MSNKESPSYQYNEPIFIKKIYIYDQDSKFYIYDQDSKFYIYDQESKFTYKNFLGINF